MLEEASGVARVRATARRLPFASAAFDGVFAVEVFEHVAAGGIVGVLDEVARVLRPGGVVAIVDKNAAACNAQRPWLPGLAIKWLDERRGRWMYPAGGPVRERWFLPRRFRRLLESRFEEVAIRYLLSEAESKRLLFRAVPSARLMTLWTGRAPGGRHGAS
jgi:2-polyprenyl-6-hydroxyphenyl methylase/3-demethylubiquinone-9 3-methyltransferase